MICQALILYLQLPYAVRIPHSPFYRGENGSTDKLKYLTAVSSEAGDSPT